MKKVSQKLNFLLILSVGISVIISSLFITGYFLIKIGEDRHEKDLIHLAGLTDSIEVFLAHATTLNYQLSLNTDIKESIVNSEPGWDLRYNNYESLYNTKEGFSENSGISLLTKMQKEYGFVELFFVQDILGDQTARSFGPIGRRGERWWFKVITEDKEYKPFLSHSYYSLTGSKPVASVFHPIIENNSFIGIMGMDINFHHLQKLMESYVISDDMYAIITDMNGVIIAHPDTEKINEIYNLVSMTHSSLAKDDKGKLDANGYQKLIEEPLDWPAEISSAVSLAVKGETGYFENIYFDKKISNLYYSPISLSQAGNSDQNYAVLLVHLQTGLVNSRNLVTFSMFLFIICIISIVYLIFRKQFKKSILIPLEKLIIAMKNIDVEKHNEILIDTDDEFTLLADTYNGLCRRLKSTNTQLLDKLDHLKESEAGYKTFSEIGLALSTERNIFRLLELILDESRKLTHADGGTLYLYDKENENLKFEIMHTETMNFYMGGTSEKPITLPPVPMYHDGEPNHSNVCTSAALNGEVINIPDVYEAVGFNFQGMREYDSRNGYHSKSMLVIPMKNMENELIGVIQLINSTIKESKEVIPFSSANQSLTISLASQAAVALTNVQLNKDLENLFHAFIKSIATAIDEKSAFTGGHIKRVVLLTTMIAEEMNNADSGVYSDINFSADELEEIHIAAWMHDIGKITTPESVVDKQTKLQRQQDGMDYLELKYQLIKQIINPDVEKETAYTSEELVEELEFLRMCNEAGEYLSDEKISRLSSIHDREIVIDGEKLPFLDDEEFNNLIIRKGNLNSKERRTIEHHAEMTKRILAELPFPKNLSNVRDYAAMHHEKLDGSGYPDGLTGDKIPLQARIIAVSDIFEALTAKDRPYRKPMKLSSALDILKSMVEENHIDGDILKFIVDTNIVQRYAEKELADDQIDIK